MKISKKNRKLANALAAWGNVADPNEIAAELQKRDDKIKTLRAEIEQLKAEIEGVKASLQLEKAYSRSLECDEYP